MVGVEDIVQRCSAGLLQQYRGIEAVPTQDGLGDAQITSLLDRQPDLLVIAGQIYDVGLCRLDTRHDGVEIGLARGVALFGYDPAATGLKGGPEIVG